jgi:general secretion pathway protein G
MNKAIDQARARRDEGFTLIELLIVIVVLGILSGIVVLGVGQFRTDATTAACNATKDNLQIAVDAFTTANPATAPTLVNIVPYLKPGATVPATITLTAAAPYTIGGTCA